MRQIMFHISAAITICTHKRTNNTRLEPRGLLQSGREVSCTLHTCASDVRTLGVVTDFWVTARESCRVQTMRSHSHHHMVKTDAGRPQWPLYPRNNYSHCAKSVLTVYALKPGIHYYTGFITGPPIWASIILHADVWRGAILLLRCDIAQYWVGTFPGRRRRLSSSSVVCYVTGVQAGRPPGAWAVGRARGRHCMAGQSSRATSRPLGRYLVTGPPLARIVLHAVVCRRRLSSSVTRVGGRPPPCRAGRVRGRCGGRYCKAGQYGYVPLVRHLIV